MNLVFRKTPAREAIIELLTSSSYPIDVAEIIVSLREKKYKINKVTVYRILEFLYKNGIINRIELGEGKYRYELQEKHHHHLICTTCGKIDDVTGDFIPNLEKQMFKNNGFLVKNHSLEFFGLCKNCQN